MLLKGGPRRGAAPPGRPDDDDAAPCRPAGGAIVAQPPADGADHGLGAQRPGCTTPAPTTRASTPTGGAEAVREVGVLPALSADTVLVHDFWAPYVDLRGDPRGMRRAAGTRPRRRRGCRPRRLGRRPGPPAGLDEPHRDCRSPAQLRLPGRSAACHLPAWLRQPPGWEANPNITAPAEARPDAPNTSTYSTPTATKSCATPQPQRSLHEQRQQARRATPQDPHEERRPPPEPCPDQSVLPHAFPPQHSPHTRPVHVRRPVHAPRTHPLFPAPTPIPGSPTE